MEGINHVHVVEVGRGRLIGQVHRVLERQVPDREGLELRVARRDPAPVLVIELAEAGGHLPAAGAGGRDDHEAAGGLDVLVPAEALFRDDQRNIGRIVGDDIMLEDPDAQHLEPLDELLRGALFAVVGDHDAADVQADAPEGVNEAKGVLVIGDPEIAAAFGALDVIRREHDHDLRVILHLQQHLYLAVRFKARQNPGRVIVVKELAAEFQIQLAAELGNPVPDVLGLKLHIFLIVETDSGHERPPSWRCSARKPPSGFPNLETAA